MNLAIDIGNTFSKAALFSGKELVSFFSFEKISEESVKDIFRKNTRIKNVILSSVARDDEKTKRFLKSTSNFIELTYQTKLPIENLYHSPETLGNDRIACAVGANFLFPAQNVLAIDAGTCIKYDFVNNKNHYLGGGISPGIEMRFKALNHFTAELPLIRYKYFDKLIGKNTDESILSGVMNGVGEETRGIIARYGKPYPDLKVVFTGGYLKFFEKIFMLMPNEFAKDNDVSNPPKESAGGLLRESRTDMQKDWSCQPERFILAGKTIQHRDSPAPIGSGNKNSDIFADAFLVLRGLNVILNHNIIANYQ